MIKEFYPPPENYYPHSSLYIWGGHYDTRSNVSRQKNYLSTKPFWLKSFYLQFFIIIFSVWNAVHCAHVRSAKTLVQKMKGWKKKKTRKVMMRGNAKKVVMRRNLKKDGRKTRTRTKKETTWIYLLMKMRNYLRSFETLIS